MKKYKHLCSSLKHAQPRAGWNSFQTVLLSPAGTPGPLTLGRSPVSRRPCGAGTRSGRLRGEGAGQADPWGERFPRSPARARTAGRGGGGGGGGGGRGGGSICGRGKPGAQVPASSLEGPGPDAASGNAPSRPQPANRFLVAGGLPPHKG